MKESKELRDKILLTLLCNPQGLTWDQIRTAIGMPDLNQGYLAKWRRNGVIELLGEKQVKKEKVTEGKVSHLTSYVKVYVLNFDAAIKVFQVNGDKAAIQQYQEIKELVDGQNK